MALREVLADLSVRVRGVAQLRATNQGISEAIAGLRGAGRALGVVGAAISGALAAGQVASFVREVVHMGDELDKAAGRIGFNAESLARWRFVAERSGVEAQKLQQGLQAMQRNAANAARGAGAGAAAFRQLHVQLRDAGGTLRTNDAVFDDTVTALAAVGDTSRRAALASQIFGEEAGAAIAAMAAQGGPALEQLRARFDQLSGGSMGRLAEQSAAAQDAFTDWTLVTTALKAQLATSFLPTLTRIVTAIADWGARIAAVLRRSNAFRVALWGLVAVLAAVAVAVSPLVLGLLLLAAPFALLFLLVEDLVTMFTGGQSAIGEFLDELFGVGTAQAVVENLTAAWEGLVLAIRTAIALLRGDPVPTASGRVTAGVEQRQRDAAAAAGRITREGDESFDQSLKRTNRLRRLQGLNPLGPGGEEVVPRARRRGPRVPVAGLTQAPTVTAGALGRPAGGQALEQRFTFGNINLTANGVEDPNALMAAVQPQIAERMQTAIGRAAARNPQARRP